MPGPGGRFLTKAPARLGPPISLLSAVDEIIPNLPSEFDPAGERWLNGIHYRTEPCENGNVGPIGCTTGQDDHTFEKDEDRTGTEKSTDPVVVYVGETCSAFGWPANEYVRRASDRLAATEAWQVEREFWTGTAAQAGISAGVDYPTDQWLANGSQGNTVTTLNSGTTLAADRAYGLLLEALSGCAGGGRGMIHAPSALLPTLQDHQIIRRDGMRYLDGKDNVVVFGGGYPGTSPTGTSPTAGSYWVFATGMVRVYRTDPVVVPGTMAEALNRMESGQHNTVTFRAERFYLIDWDRCCHFAMQITAG